jgi:hypothetical protein
MVYLEIGLGLVIVLMRGFEVGFDLGDYFWEFFLNLDIFKKFLE